MIYIGGVLNRLQNMYRKGYNLQVYVTPGDSISFEIKNKDIFFKGKNAAHYNFFKEMKTLDLVRPYFYGDLDEYKKKCKIYFKFAIPSSLAFIASSPMSSV